MPNIHVPDGTSPLSPPTLPKPPKWEIDPADPRYQLRLRPAHPAGVVILMTLNLVVAAFLLLIFFLGFFQSTSVDAAAYLLPLPALFAIIIGFGLWKLYPWARLMDIAFYVFSAVIFFVTAFTHPFSFGDVLDVVIPLVVIAYLLQPSVRAAFEHHSQLSGDQTGSDIDIEQPANDN